MLGDKNVLWNFFYFNLYIYRIFVFYELGLENKVYSRIMYFDKINKKRVEKLRLNNWIK